jgi:hypothetical protein
MTPGERRSSSTFLPTRWTGVCCQTWEMGYALLAPPEERLHLVREARHLVRDHVPHDVEIDAEVGVDQDVTEAADLRPLDVRGSFPDGGRDLLDGLPDDLQVADDRIDGLGSSPKLSRVYPST